MTSFRPKLWASVSAAILLGACSGGESGEAGEPASAPTAEAPAAGEGGEGGAEGGGAGGEAGAQAAYVGVPADSRVALRLAHLRGFFLIAQKVTDPDEAGALAGQGMLEVYDVQPGAFESVGINKAVLDKAAETGAKADLAAALKAIDAASAKAGGDQAKVAKAMVSIAQGLYALVVTPEGVDPIEYQHSLGAALSAKQSLDAAAGSNPAAKAAQADMNKLIALWPATDAPEAPTPVAQLSGQAARVELAL